MGGSDQWGNITTGTELIRRKTSGEAFALTTPLITRSDGAKFGKTESGNVWLDTSMTSTYHFYQFWLNVADEDAKKLIRVFTLLPEETINELLRQHDAAPHNRILQKTLAEEITIRVHSKVEYDKAISASQVLFGRSTTKDLEQIEESMLLDIFEGVPHTKISTSTLTEASDITDLLSVNTNQIIFKSKGEARRMIQGGGVSVNKMKISSPEQKPDFSLLQKKYLLVQKGKKNYYLIKVED